MEPYHKIQSIYYRDPENNYKSFTYGKYSRECFGYLYNSVWEFTEKVDGTNIRVIFDGEGGVRYAGRSDRAQLHPQLLDYLREHLEGYAGDFDEPLTLYGEGYGAGIQKGGGNYSPEKEFVLFDVYSTCWWRRDSVEDIARQLDIDVVPIIGRGSLATAEDMARGGIQSRWGDFEAEGIVARPEVELCDNRGQRIITKVKTRDYR